MVSNHHTLPVCNILQTAVATVSRGSRNAEVNVRVLRGHFNQSINQRNTTGHLRDFDPLGVIAPVVIQAKVLMQTLWRCKIAWDKPLNEELHAEQKDIANDLKAASELSVRRGTMLQMLNTSSL